MKLVDPNGEDWYEIVNDETKENEVKWTDYHSQEEMDENGIEGYYLGQAHIVFNGSRYEHPDKNGSIDGENSACADVTLYGPNGEDDIHYYNGYTMTSNANKYIPIAEGIYEGHTDRNKKGKLKSNLSISDPIASAKTKSRTCYTMDMKKNTNPDCMDDWNYKTVYKTGIFIHSTGSNGRLGIRNSTGCLLISDSDWDDFKKAMTGVKNFSVRVNRTK